MVILPQLFDAYAFRAVPHLEFCDRVKVIQDEPFVSTSIYAQHRVMRLARENGIKVLLDGQGADELLGGYPGHWSARIASLISKPAFDNAYRT